MKIRCHQGTYIFESFTELLLEKVGVFLEDNKDKRMKARSWVLVRL